MGFTMTSAEWAQACSSDYEFMMAARSWNGGLRLRTDGASVEIGVVDGAPVAKVASNDMVFEFKGTADVWDKVLAAVPPQFNNELMSNLAQRQGLSFKADRLLFAQYYQAVSRAVELLRPPADEGQAVAHDQKPDGVFDAPVGRYVHLTLGGIKHRLYFEEAGSGIPVLLQHTAGCHGSQWRHLLEDEEITSRFRLIAYDLPYHGKSLPPSDMPWWDQEYRLTGDTLRSIPIKLAEALELDRPVFIGCSVGGLLALDLAHKHPECFRAVISLEGALEIPGTTESESLLWHPQVSNEYKANLMKALMSPASPKRYRKETSFVYASGWPPAFIGDLHYYMNEFDLRQSASAIDTSQVAVYILSGEYDISGTPELGKQAHQAIPGSSWQEMKDVGHFPMSENPEQFRTYLLPVLDEIAQE